VAVQQREEGDERHQDPERKLANDVGDAQLRQRDQLREAGAAPESLVHLRQDCGDQRPFGCRFGLVLLLGLGGAAALRFRRQRLDRHGKAPVDDGERDESDRHPEQAVVEEDAVGRMRRPRQQLRVLLDHGPVAGHHVGHLQPDGIEDARPEVFERARRVEDRGEGEVQHQHRDALHIDQEDLAGERGDQEEERAEEEDLDDDDGEERLPVPPRVSAGDAGVVGPGSERPQRLAEDHAREGEDAGDERAGPASAQVGELADGLGEDHLVGVALEVAQHRRAEDGGDDDGPEQGEEAVEDGRRIGPVQQLLAVAGVDEVFGGDGHEAEQEPQPEVDVGGKALQPEL
jgi:hypothetical protein